MQLRMWMYDLAREQSPTLDHLRAFLKMTRESGYNAFGLYLEHRFAYASTPWSHGLGCVTAEMVGKLVSEFPEVQIIPFVNLLGHFEGMIYTEEGKQYRETLFEGMQACPSNPAFVKLCEKLIDDVVDVFPSEIIHIGGDETWQLGSCPACRSNVEVFEGDQAAGRSDRQASDGIAPNTRHPARDTIDGKAELYALHFGPLARRVVEKRRRPAVWGDMFLEHPSALTHMPKETLIFDWHYFESPESTSRWFKDKGFDVVCCPTIQTYNATWMHLAESEASVRQHVADASAIDAHGVCVTTWECGLFGSYDTLIPAIRACGQILGSTPLPSSSSEQERSPSNGEEGAFLRRYLSESERYEEWARLMGFELQSVGGPFAHSRTRSSIKCRFLLYSNPFLAWMHHAGDFCGEIGDKAMDVIDRAMAVAPSEATKGITLFARSAIEFVRLSEQTRIEYMKKNAEAAVGILSQTRKIFDDLGGVARATHERIGGSLTDIERCKSAKAHVEAVIKRIRHYGDGSLGYLPSFEMITHPKFVPHDQAGWWLVNRWANQ